MKESVVQQLTENLDAFVFFHLGSDAKVTLEEKSDGLDISVQHQRIQPIRLQIDRQRLEALAADPALFEETMLEQLVARRRS